MLLKRLLYKIIYWGTGIINFPQLKFNNVKMGAGCKLRGKLYVKRAGKRSGVSITIGEGVCINSSLKADPIGGQTRTILYTRHNGRIQIGKGVGISNTAIVSEISVKIGDYSNIGGGTKIYDTDFHSLDPEIRLHGDDDIHNAPVNIGSCVFVGGHCIILKGVTIGDNAVVGAGSVVTKNIPANEIWAGNPARFIKKVGV